MNAVSRRSVLIGAAALAAAAAAGGNLVSAAPARAATVTDIANLRGRCIDVITGRAEMKQTPEVFTTALRGLIAEVNDWVTKIEPDLANRKKVFTDDDFDPRKRGDGKAAFNSRAITDTYERLATMAQVWATPSIPGVENPYYKGNENSDLPEILLNHIRDGLYTGHSHYYHKGQTVFSEHWWDWEIGTSQQLVKALVLMGDQLNSTRFAYYAEDLRFFVRHPDRLKAVPGYVEWYNNHPDFDGTYTEKDSTAYNRAALAHVAILEGVVIGSVTRIDTGVTSALGAFEWASHLPASENTDLADGMWADGSFLQHQNVAYNGGYGSAMVSLGAEMFVELAGSPWAFAADSSIRNLIPFVDLGLIPVVHDSRMMSFVRGREIARPKSSEGGKGTGVMVSMLRLAESGAVQDAATAARWRGTIQGWLERRISNGGSDPRNSAKMESVALFDRLAKSGVAALPEPDGSVIYRNMARAVHRRNGWAFAISMNSERIARYEADARENLHGWHTGDGMTYLYDKDYDQYHDGYWATVDPYSLAGTTIDKHVIADGAERQMSSNSWAGGAVLDGRYSAVGMALRSGDENLSAQKTWFCLDEMIICVGTGITGTNPDPTRTIVENRKLHDGENVVTVGNAGTETQVTQPGSGWFDQPRWAHIDGGDGKRVGYVFTQRAERRLFVRRETMTGRWSDITEKADPTDPAITNNFAILSLHHGIRPSNDMYIYMVVPNATVDRTRQLSTTWNDDVTFLGHNTDRCGIQQQSKGLLMANFWQPDTLGRVTVDGPCSVIVQEKNGVLTVAVANPRRNAATIRVTVTGASGFSQVRKDSGVTVASTGATIVLDIAAGTLGKTYSATFAR